jgi:hypothetical protein
MPGKARDSSAKTLDAVEKLGQSVGTMQYFAV